MRGAVPILLSLSVSACGASRGPLIAKGPIVQGPDTSRVMAVLGRSPIGHACPIGAEMVLTAAHVMDPVPGNRDVPYQYLRWSDEAGGQGFLIPVATVVGSDLAVMKPHEPLNGWFARAALPPVSGDRLWLVEYDFDSRDRAFEAKPLEVTVIRVVAGSVVFKPSGERGSSGSCVLNESGELVAIQAWGVPVGIASEVGVAVGVWGSWFELEGK